jgi:hypothetical protein
MDDQLHEAHALSEETRMRQDWIVVALVALVAATALLWTWSARASPRRQDPDVVEVQAPAGPDAEAIEDALLEMEEQAEQQAGKDQALYAGLIAISPGGGWRLPPPADVDTADWQRFDAGQASLRVPRGWTELNRIGDPGAGDETVGVAPEAQDLYVELRHIRDSDPSYRQGYLDHVHSDYGRSVDRLAEGVIHGFEPRIVDGAVGGIEVMDQFGKPVDEEGKPTFRLVLWRGRWQEGETIHRVQLEATLAQDRYEEFAPLFARILETVRITHGP